MRGISFLSLSFIYTTVTGQTDTLRIMSYNVLYYGDRPACQGPHSIYHNYLKTIVQYARPDVLGLVKMAAIPTYAGDNAGTAPLGFADSVLQFALNAGIPGTYDYCPFTNVSQGDAMSVLFYNTQKLGFISIVSSYANITDFNTYKLYYKAPDLASTHDTAFLYITLNHTQSGSGNSNTATRAAQILGEMQEIQTHFAQLPDMVNMGDFNTHNSSEGCYQELVAPVNSSFTFYDPPFSIDGAVTYPADWDNDPDNYSRYLTTSTRLSGSIPNSCGTSGGAKSWYDHMFISNTIANHTGRFTYIPHSYITIGNDGNRNGISINDNPANTAAPANVVDALFQMSNKYPVMLQLIVNNTATKVTGIEKPKINIVNPVAENLVLYIPTELCNKELITVECIDMLGRVQMRMAMQANSVLEMPAGIRPGAYNIRCSVNNVVIYNSIIQKL